MHACIFELAIVSFFKGKVGFFQMLENVCIMYSVISERLLRLKIEELAN